MVFIEPLLIILWSSGKLIHFCQTPFVPGTISPFTSVRAHRARKPKKSGVAGNSNTG